MNVTQSLPHAVGPEKSVLSTLLQDPAFIEDASTLTTEHFHIPAHRTIFELIRELTCAGQEVELVSFTQHLLNKGLLDRVGGPAALTDIYTYAPSPGHFQNHIKLLTEKLACRMAIAAAHEIERVAYESEVQDIIEATSAPITAIHDTLTGSVAAPNARELGAEFIANFERLVRGHKKPTGIETGITEIDRAIRGLNPGMLGIISARSSGGKSTLATQILCGIACPEIPAIYLPLEGTTQAAYNRCVIQLSRLPAMAVTAPLEYAQLQDRGSLSKAELVAVQNAVGTLTGGGFHFDPPANRRLATILSTIRRARRRHGVQVAFVDYIQLIHGPKSATKEEELSVISHALQELAAELGIIIVLMSQENDSGETKHARTIEEDCDWWLSIVQHRDRSKENFQQHRHILVSKDRHHGNGGLRLPLQLDRSKVRFVFAEEVREKSKGATPNF